MDVNLNNNNLLKSFPQDIKTSRPSYEKANINYTPTAAQNNMPKDSRAKYTCAVGMLALCAGILLYLSGAFSKLNKTIKKDAFSTLLSMYGKLENVPNNDLKKLLSNTKNIKMSDLHIKGQQMFLANNKPLNGIFRIDNSSTQNVYKIENGIQKYNVTFDKNGEPCYISYFDTDDNIDKRVKFIENGKRILQEKFAPSEKIKNINYAKRAAELLKSEHLKDARMGYLTSCANRKIIFLNQQANGKVEIVKDFPGKNSDNITANGLFKIFQLAENDNFYTIERFVDGVSKFKFTFEYGKPVSYSKFKDGKYILVNLDGNGKVANVVNSTTIQV